MILFGISIPFINFILCSFISLFGYLYYKKIKNSTPLLIAIAFTAFGVSHFLLLLGVEQLLFSEVIIRSFAYLLIILALLNTIKIKKYLFAIAAATVLTLILILIFFYTPTAKIFLQLPIFNLFFCLTIIALGVITYKKHPNSISFYLAISYGIFALSHIAMILNMQEKFMGALIIIRIFAYILIIGMLYSLVETEISHFIIKYITKGRVQITIVGITIIILLILFYFPHLKFNCSDPYPFINPIKPSLAERQITEVKTGLYVKNFPTYDITTNNFVMNAILWFEFNPHTISINTINKFSFEKGTILEKSKPEIKIIGEKLFVCYKIKLKFKSNLDFKLFPLEDHRLNLILTNTSLNPAEAVLTSYNTDLKIPKHIFTNDWKIIQGEVDYGYLKSEIDEDDPRKTSLYSAVSFSLEFKKAGIKKTLMLFIPIFIAFFLSIFSLLINIKNKGGILSLSVGAVTSLIINLFTIQKMTPNVRYFTLSDSIFMLLLLSVFTILMLNIYLIKQIKEKKNLNNLILIRNYTFLFFVTLIPLIIYYLVY